MGEKRNSPRYQTTAKVKIEGIDKGDINLMDISITGCRVVCSDYEEIELNKQYKIEVIPESAAKVGLFDFFAESKWIRTDIYSSEIGFIIVESPKGKQFQRYVDYLSWRYSQGNSMTGETITETLPGAYSG
ncbi:MAG: PilZ domain-containing protein [Treponema sp.]|jgi:hypothetical protein|nr:PilZ domain-containing protein [Treponema sp.]